MKQSEPNTHNNDNKIIWEPITSQQNKFIDSNAVCEPSDCDDNVHLTIICSN